MPVLLSHPLWDRGPGNRQGAGEDGEYLRVLTVTDLLGKLLNLALILRLPSTSSVNLEKERITSPRTVAQRAFVLPHRNQWATAHSYMACRQDCSFSWWALAVAF